MNAVVSFESDVVPDSGKTGRRRYRLGRRFESDVVPDSGKTYPHLLFTTPLFESDVVPDSGKTARNSAGAMFAV